MTAASLSWGGLIPTLGRPQWVVACVRCLLRQRVPPAEIVVVAAEGDDSTQPELFDAIDGLHDRVRFKFVRAPRGLTIQRNAGVQTMTSDICVLVDDDLYFAADFMERVFAGFAADEDGRLGGIQGVVIEGDEAQSWFRAQEFAPRDAAASEAPAPAGSAAAPLRRLKSKARRTLWAQMHRYIGPMFPEIHAANQPFGEKLRAAGLVPASHLGGGCTAYRREAMRNLRFCEIFAGYAAAEDINFSVQVARRWAIATCPAARGYHLQIASARPDTARISFSALLNLAYTARTAMGPTPELTAHVLRHHRRSARSWAVMGLLGGRGLGDYRAASLAAEEAERLLTAADSEVDDVYQRAVQRFEATRTSSRLRN